MFRCVWGVTGLTLTSVFPRLPPFPVSRSELTSTSLLWWLAVLWYPLLHVSPCLYLNTHFTFKNHTQVIRQEATTPTQIVPTPLLAHPSPPRWRQLSPGNVLKLKGDDGPCDVRLTAREENLGMAQSRTYELYEMSYGMFQGIGMGRGKGGTRGGTSIGRQKEKRGNILVVCRQW